MRTELRLEVCGDFADIDKFGEGLGSSTLGSYNGQDNAQVNSSFDLQI